MEISLVWNILFVATLSQGIFVTVVLFIQFLRKRQISQLFLSTMILVFSAILLNNIIYWNAKFPEYPQFIFSTVSIRFLLAPLFFLYCQSFFRPALQWRDSLHFLPFLVITYLYAPAIFLSGADKLALMSTPSEVSSKGSFLITIGIFLPWFFSGQIIVYASCILRKLNNKWRGAGLANNAQLQWLKVLDLLFLLYGLLMFLYYVMVSLDIGGIQKDYYISAVICVAIYAISYVGMINPSLLNGELLLAKIAQPKYAKNRMSDAYLQQIATRLKEQVSTNRSLLNADTTLDSFAQQLAIPKHHITQALNLEIGQSFYQFLNSHRIAYACLLLEQLSPGENIKTVMYASGFNNRVSFNENFKKQMGMTASQYLRACQH